VSPGDAGRRPGRTGSGAPSAAKHDTDSVAERPVNLAELAPRERWLWLDGFGWGCVHGALGEVAAGEARDAEIFRRAVAVVHANATLPPRDPDADRARAARRLERWSA
jgi:hypothetical protein